MAKYEFDGISTENFNPEDIKGFEECYDGTLIEKRPFEVELEEKNINLHIFIQDTDMSEYEDSEDHVITLGVVPNFDSLSEKHQEDILSQFIEEDRDRLKEDKETLIHEGLCYGFGVPLHTVTVKPEEVEHTINSAIAVRSGVSGLIGFELDRPRNMMGSTGWDLLDDYCCDIDFIKATMDRYK